MNNFLLYLLKSTLILSVLYLVFSLLMRKDNFFKINRMVLLLIVLSAALIPFLPSPPLIQPFRQAAMEPIFQNPVVLEESIQTTAVPESIQLTDPVNETVKPLYLSPENILLVVYLSGAFVSLLVLLYSIGSVLLLFRTARKTVQNGIRLMIVPNDISAFSFGRSILISQQDYELHSQTIITHERSHIRMGHFYDLVLMELAKIIFWFNPLVYRMVNDLKEIHEFQADNHTLTSGIDATKYQLLIIQKSVGSQKFALANSFNHCQIKNRITMMNKQKTSKAWSWKVATFLPLLALLLMAFGREGKNVQMEIASSAIESPSITNETPSITGTWRLASYNYGGGDEWKPAPEGIVKIKLITETSFSWNHYVGTDKRVVDSAGGSYVLSGEDYTETVEYGGSGMADYVGKEQKFKVKIEKDKMELSGELSSGLKIKEIWVRYHTSDQTSTSQNVNLSQDKPDDQVYLTAEVMAEFPGGDRAMREYIANNVKYPKEAEEKRIQGKVYVTFIVNSQGKIVNPKIVKGAAPALDAEAIRVVQSMPTWIPGKNKGVPVSLSYTTPINFVLQ